MFATVCQFTELDSFFPSPSENGYDFYHRVQSGAAGGGELHGSTFWRGENANYGKGKKGGYTQGTHKY